MKKKDYLTIEIAHGDNYSQKLEALFSGQEAELFYSNPYVEPAYAVCAITDGRYAVVVQGGASDVVTIFPRFDDYIHHQKERWTAELAKARGKGY